jgi:phospholipase C
MRYFRIPSFVFILLEICLVIGGRGMAAGAVLPTVTFSASPVTIGTGSSSTLTWKTTNATSVSISSIGAVALTGTKSVKPTATTTYTLTAKGAGGTKTAAVTVTVKALTTAAITASPATVASGGSSTLTVKVTNGSSVAITNNVNATSIPVSAGGGSVVVKPTQTTIYTATATGAVNKASASTTVTVTTVTAAPTVTIKAAPATISSGGTSTLTVTATNATGVVVTNNSDATTLNLGATGGSQAVTPTKTTTYTATATGVGGTSTAAATVTVITVTAPTVTIQASPATIASGGTSTLTVTATNATGVVVTNSSDATTFNLGATGGTQSVTPTKTTTYTATATGAGGTSTAVTTVTVSAGNAQAIQHVLFLQQENRTFDTYFGMLNPYRINHGWNIGDDGKEYDVDGIDDKLSTITNVNDEGAVFPLFKTTSTCLDDMTSAWLESFGDVSRFDFSTTRQIKMDGFVHVAENFAKSGAGSGAFTDLVGQRAMAYYDEGFLNYYYFMASQFALSDRWFSPVASKSIPNRIAAMTGGTTQGLVRDPGKDDRLPQLGVQTIFQKLSTAGVSWKIYYSETNDNCAVQAGNTCKPATINRFPSTTFSYFSYANNFVFNKSAAKPTCTGTTQDSGTAVGDPNNAFCIDTSKIAPVTQLFTDMANGTLPSFAYIEAGFGSNDEHPGSGQSILKGQSEASSMLNALMASPSWANSAFFLAYDEGGGPYDHVPPVPGHTNDFTDASLGVTTDIGSIAVNPDSFKPCLPAVAGTPTTHCDLVATDPGAKATDTAAVNGFAAQLGFRLPNMVVSPFTRKHFVSHTPMDHTAVIKFVESRFIGPTASLTARDAAQPDLLEFFDFTAIPWSAPPTPPAPFADATGTTCTPASMGP